MAFYLSSKKIDITSGDNVACIINEVDALEHGVRAGDSVQMTWEGLTEPIICIVDTTDSLIREGQVGFHADDWDALGLKTSIPIQIDFIEASEAVESIRKKLNGGRLNYEEFHSIMKDVANGKLNDILTSYFAASGYSPGFNEEEISHMTKALANTGEILKFDGIVADKHSIGGVAGKGITPIIVPVIASFDGLIVPNTSTRAVTSASATTDMLEVIMPMSFDRESLEEMIAKSGVFMVWGGGLALAPADDKIIEVQKPLGMESIDKFVSSIVAKKIAQGVNHVVFDVPVGRGAKITEEEFPLVRDTFERICAQFNIKVAIFKRQISGIDGFAVGPALECREFLRVFENHPEKSIQLEKDALLMAGTLLELCGVVEPGKGFDAAKEKITNGQAYSKLKEIIKNQGGNPDVKSNELEIGGITEEIVAKNTGKFSFIDNKKVFMALKALGNPRIKEAGVYFHKTLGDDVVKGEKIATLYATSESRMSLGKKVWESQNPIEIVGSL